MVCLGQLGRVSEHIVKMSTLPKDNPRSAPRCVNIVVSLVGRVFHQYVLKRRVDRQRVTDRQWNPLNSLAAEPTITQGNLEAALLLPADVVRSLQDRSGLKRFS